MLGLVAAGPAFGQAAGRTSLISRTAAGAPADGVSGGAVSRACRGGTSVFLDTAARNLRPPGDDVPARRVAYTVRVPFVVSTAPAGGPMPSDAMRADPSAQLNHVVFEAAGSV